MEKEFIDRIIQGAKHTNRALILYGSYSRGDFDQSSDIDVLEITERPQTPYSISNINYSPYSSQQLQKMADEGNLFVLHIIKEGQVISGDENILNEINKKFVYPDNYDFLRAQIIETAGLLDIGESGFSMNSRGYYGLLCYLLRSYIYSLAIDQRDISFSVKYLSKKFDNDDVATLFALKKSKRISFSEYQWCKSVFENFTEEKFENNLVDSVELLKSLQNSSPFGFKVAMHFLHNLASEVYV
ncbi:nucleotidyltransferase domain-containing protein [Sediminibacterium roseum]|uniref:Nucleotidyltransferase domain-containing protein n=2 Tax=Sediminibacterium roseum TaxID=1978412 RepID=A0ABW9ZZB2_9BACT|nr:nucleotidyltransferase domain-containing protein [Sediminibacterium roseum]